MEFVEVIEPVNVAYMPNMKFRVTAVVYDLTRLSIGDILCFGDTIGRICEITNSSSLTCESISTYFQAGIYESFEIEFGAFYRAKGE